jgi:2-methylcitrate dehydratase PrpD
MDETRTLAKYVAAMSFEMLPGDVVATAINAIRDNLGVGLYASRLPWSGHVAELAFDLGGGGRSTVWGHKGAVNAVHAAMANGTSAHGIEMDDRNHLLDIHNGSATIPAAMAVAEQINAETQQLILGVVAGYEVAFRVARATHRKITRFYAPSIRSIFGATVAAAKVFELDADGVTNAIGIAGSMAAGLLEHTIDNSGSMVKRLQGGGWPAHCGVMAASLARKGFTAPGTMLEGTHGVCRSFSTDGEPDIDALTSGLGADFEILGWQTKLYAAWGGSHSSIDAVRALRALGNPDEIEPSEIADIEVACSSKVMQFADHEQPESIMSAQYHLPTIIAAAFFYDIRDPSVWNANIWADPRVRRVAGVVHAHIDPEIEAIFAATNDPGGVRLTVRLRSGREVVRSVRHSLGTPENPPSEDELAAKFTMLAGAALPGGQVVKLADALAHLADPGAMAAISDLLSAQ